MERYKETGPISDETLLDDLGANEDDLIAELRAKEGVTPREKRAQFERISAKHERRLRGKSRTRKVAGSILTLIGAGTVTTACPFYALAFIGPETVMAGIVMIIGGAALILSKPKLKDTHQAMLVAARNDNVLTVPRLALEMDISFKRAEEIVKELVKNDIAEMDIDNKDADGALLYRIKGL